MTKALDASSVVTLKVVNLGPLLARSRGSAQIGIGLLDGPVAVGHPDLSAAAIRAVGLEPGACVRSGSASCIHGTFVAGILVAARESAAPGICPDCTLLVRPIFREGDADGMLPGARPGEVANAIVECVEAGARVLNLSASTGRPSPRTEPAVRDALDYAVRRGAILVAAAGNQGTLGSSAITRHPAVIPVVAYDLRGRPLGQTNLGGSLGRWGLGAPGDGIVSTVPGGVDGPRAGTSFAAAFVTGVIALLWSLLPTAGATVIRDALCGGVRRRAVVPPLLDAERAYERLIRRAAA